jgi:hypothetical protein
MLGEAIYFLQRLKILIILHSQMDRSLSICHLLQCLKLELKIKSKRPKNQSEDFLDFKIIIKVKSKYIVNININFLDLIKLKELWTMKIIKYFKRMTI